MKPWASNVLTIPLTDGALIMKCRAISSNAGGTPRFSV